MVEQLTYRTALFCILKSYVYSTNYIFYNGKLEFHVLTGVINPTLPTL
jgi:hypothetical protein